MDKFAEWSRDLDFPYSELRDRLEFLEPRLLDDYDPTRGEARFSRRLSEWLDGVGSDNEQRELFALLEYIYFVGEDELSVLYRESFNAQVMWWLSADYPSLGDAGHQDFINREVERYLVLSRDGQHEHCSVSPLEPNIRKIPSS